MLWRRTDGKRIGVQVVVRREGGHASVACATLPSTQRRKKMADSECKNLQSRLVPLAMCIMHNAGAAE